MVKTALFLDFRINFAGIVYTLLYSSSKDIVKGSELKHCLLEKLDWEKPVQGSEPRQRASVNKGLCEDSESSKI